MAKFNKNDNRRSNIPSSNSSNKKEGPKVSNGVFV